MIKNLPTLESISTLGYTKLFNLRKSLKSKLSIRERSLKDEILNNEKISAELNSPNSTLTLGDLAVSESQIMKIKSEIMVINIYLGEINKYLEPMLKELHSVGQPGNE